MEQEMTHPQSSQQAANDNHESTGTTTTTNSNNNPQTQILRVAVGSTNPVKVNAVKMAIQKVLCNHSNNNSNTSATDDASTNAHPTMELHVQGFSVPSGVPDQPFGDDETKLGAKNRAKLAYQQYQRDNGMAPDLAVGLEGGLEWSKPFTCPTVQLDEEQMLNAEEEEEETEDTLWCMAWMAIYGKHTIHLQNCMAYKKDANQTIVPSNKLKCSFSKTGSFLVPSILAGYIRSGMELGHADDKVFGRTNSKHKSGSVGILTGDIIDRALYYEHALILALIPWIRPDVYTPQ